jgi:GTP-binding protein
MALPLVAIIGRPNVGKSSLFNYLSGRMISIVDPTAGVTRDRITTPIHHDGHWFDLTDTGGYGIVDRDNLEEDVTRQIDFAIREAQLVLFVVDVQTGLTPLDKTVAELLRRYEKPILLVCNKADSSRLTYQMGEFYSLGFGNPHPMSCTANQGRPALLDAIVDKLDFRAVGPNPSPDAEMKIAVVGKRNAGKSSLINAIAGTERVIVSEIAGTTRDSVDVRFDYEGRTFIVIDTAGVRKKSKITRDDLEFYSFHRAQRSIRRADVVLLMIDALADLGDVDQKLAAYIAAEFKPVICVINKWDMVPKGTTPEMFQEYLGKIMRHLDYAPLAFISAKTKENIHETIHLATRLVEQAKTRLTTANLNKAVEDIIQTRGPSSSSLEKVKVYYATQTDTNPPTIVLFVNNPDYITAEYRRYFVRQLRMRLPFAEVPIKLLVRHHRKPKNLDRD